VLAVGLVGALAATLLALAVVAAGVVANQRAVTASDLAALAGAQALIDGGTLSAACQAATDTARSNGAELTSCGRSPPNDLAVSCSIGVDLPVLGQRAAMASAVAGPP
jgi:secretion/DNA translocation related TadE-like protein